MQEENYELDKTGDFRKEEDKKRKMKEEENWRSKKRVGEKKRWRKNEKG